METAFKLFLIVHIIAGTIGLLAGTLNTIFKKGETRHKLIGKFFLLGMTVNALCSFVLAVLHPNNFLFIVGVFSLYLVQAGNRILKLKIIGEHNKPQLFDWLLQLGMIVFGCVFIGLGVAGLIQKNTFGFVYIVFGFIGMRLAMQDIGYFKQKITNKKYWLISHLSKMMGGYIAATTAFLVVNNKILPPILAWLLPTVFGSYLIFKWVRGVKKQTKF